MAQGYAGVPAGPLSAYLGVRDANQQAGFQDIQAASQIQGMLAKQQQMQEIEQIKAVVSQAGGDPAKASEALLRLGTPGAMKLATDIKDSFLKSQVIPAGATVRTPGQQDFTAPNRPERPQKFAPPEIVRLQETLATLQPGDPNRAMIENRMKFLTEREPRQPPQPQPPVAVLGSDDKPIYVDRSNAIGMRPVPPASASRPAEISPEAAAQIVEQEGTKLLALIGTDPTSAASLLSPVARGYEAARGLVDTKYEGPALTSQASKQRLLFAVDQLVKSGKSSNEFLRRLESSLGMGTVTTPQNARKAIQEAINMTRGMAGLPPIEAPPTPKGKSPSEMSNEELLRALTGGSGG